MLIVGLVICLLILVAWIAWACVKLTHRYNPGTEKLSYHPTAFLARWQHMTVAEQKRRFLAWWEKSSVWLGIAPGGKILAQGKQVVEARAALLAHPTSSSPGKWYRTSSLLYSIWKRSPLVAASIKAVRCDPPAEAGPVSTVWISW
jgi:hypothetical protein